MQGKQLLIWIWNYEKEHKRQRKGEKELLGRGKRMVQKAWKDLKKFSLAEAWKLSLKIEHDELFITWQRSWTLVCRQWAANTHGHILNLLFFFLFLKIIDSGAMSWVQNELWEEQIRGRKLVLRLFRWQII